jgi:hypothetical protein
LCAEVDINFQAERGATSIVEAGFGGGRNPGVDHRRVALAGCPAPNSLYIGRLDDMLALEASN